ncbi:MAG: hypothetical protein ACREEB_06085 [Caulobacteraceae bacterium]
MWKTFDSVMWVVSCLLGLVMIAFGAIWILQGLNLAFNGPMAGGSPSFMVGNPMWIVFGAVLALIGLAELVWSIRRRG